MKFNKKYDVNDKSFHFNLNSTKRLSQPMKFDIKNMKKGGYVLYGNSEKGLISIGNIGLEKENYGNTSSCCQNEKDFDYKGIKKALCGKNGYEETFILKRFIVIQMN